MGHSALKPATDERWSDLKEVRDLLQFDGRLSGLDDNLMFRRRRIKAGQSVFLMGQAFEGLYVVRFGNLKTTITTMAASMCWALRSRAVCWVAMACARTSTAMRRWR